MPKAYDIKRNYYADLELPINASIDDIKKQYRKLAKIWHPDRNAGKEEECVPRFQAIQAAHEILSDPVNKAQYDADRRVAGPFKTTATAGPVPRGNPYQATSNFPPPPRRTPQPASYPRPPRPQANGAERFSNFGSSAQPPPPKRPDPAQSRTNVFTAWQNMQNRQQRPDAQDTAPPGPSTPSGQNPPRRPRPFPRADTEYPTEEKIRAGFKHHDASSVDSEAEARRSAWEATRNAVPEPGIRRSNTTQTPRRQGFDPNVPGSDERPTAGHYVHRHKSEDFGQPSERRDGMPSPAVTPPSPRVHRPHINPTDPKRRQPLPDHVPYSEANRLRTPYTSYVGEKTDMRRSASSRDNTKLDPPQSPFRPNSTSPLGVPRGATFEFPNAESDIESPAPGSSPETPLDPFTKPPNFANPSADRPKKVPSPPSRRYNGTQAAFCPPSADSTEELKKDNIFNFGNAPPFSPPPLPTGKSRSEESINTKFAQDFNGTFSSNAETSQSRPTSRKANFPRQNSRGRATPTFGQPSALGSKLTRSDLPPPPTSAPNTFSPEVWQQHFADGSWAVPPPPPGGPKVTSPVQSAQQESVTPDKARDSGYSPSDSDRMDIDDVPPSQTANDREAMPPPQTANDRQAMPPPPKPPRQVPVPPSQWHQQQSAKVAGLKTNLDDLSHVEPITKADGSGLESLTGLTADLPFKSQASQSSPVSPVDTQHQRIPTIPIPPQLPSAATKLTWAHYAAEFGMYVGAFHDFNGKFLLHFNTRQTAMKMKIDKGMDWLQATGDTSNSSNGPSGFTAYARQIEGDARLREIWNVACEKHVVAVKQFEDFRERVRRAASGGGLVDR